jgi:hypothetical protein
VGAWREEVTAAEGSMVPVVTSKSHGDARGSHSTLQ